MVAVARRYRRLARHLQWPILPIDSGGGASGIDKLGDRRPGGRADDGIERRPGKYNSGCGWPAFHTEHKSAKISRIEDYTYGMNRIEVRCSKCDAHLGHVFNDGPRENGGERYCINSASIEFRD